MIFNAYRLVVDAVGDKIAEGKMFTSYEILFGLKALIPDFELTIVDVRRIVKGLYQGGLFEGSGYTKTKVNLSVGQTGHARVFHPVDSNALDYPIATGLR